MSAEKSHKEHGIKLPTVPTPVESAAAPAVGASGLLHVRAAHGARARSLELELLAEAAHHEQRIVHGHAQPEQRDDIDREDRDVGDLGEQPASTRRQLGASADQHQADVRPPRKEGLEGSSALQHRADVPGQVPGAVGHADGTTSGEGAPGGADPARDGAAPRRFPAGRGRAGPAGVSRARTAPRR